jgi:hypothetical protein
MVAVKKREKQPALSPFCPIPSFFVGSADLHVVIFPFATPLIRLCNTREKKEKEKKGQERQKKKSLAFFQAAPRWYDDECGKHPTVGVLEADECCRDIYLLTRWGSGSGVVSQVDAPPTQK